MKPDEKLTLGWREWVGLPELGLAEIKAKVDTGARTSTLHAFELHTFSEGGKPRVRFKMHPLQKNSQEKKSGKKSGHPSLLQGRNMGVLTFL